MSAFRRTAPLTKHATGGPGGLGIVRTGIFPAAAVPRRVVEMLLTSPPTRRWARTVAMSGGLLGGHLGPKEAAQLPGDGGRHDILKVLPCRQTSEPAA